MKEVKEKTKTFLALFIFKNWSIGMILILNTKVLTGQLRLVRHFI